MNQALLMSLVVFVIAIVMSMVGKGGGTFYVLVMLIFGVAMHEAATTSQLIMMATSVTAMTVFNKHKKIDWKLALVIDPPTAIMAFVGGYYAGNIDGELLEIVFVAVLVAVSCFMFISVKEKPIDKVKRFGYWNRSFKNYNYTVNLWLTLPITALVGLVSGAIGISGGVFKIPLMVMLCGIPMEIAVGTSSAMVAATAFMGFMGQNVSGNFNPQFAVPLTIAAVVGGLIGSKCAIKSKPGNLKKIFAITNLLAAIIMIIQLVK
ncbi:MAG: sulfite exporter TauE/SafE family protein [Peptostreptococcaceae bacterium]|nr:sulfite exporter TauE/SafE family protein [Peptostreptococcaceae bacterium]